MNDSTNDGKLRELRLLISQALDGSLSRDGILRMERMLESDSDMRSYYREYLSMYCDLFILVGRQQLNPDDIIYDIEDKEFWETLANYENMAPVIDMPKQPQEQMVIERIPSLPKAKYKLNKFSVISVISSIAAVILIAIFGRFVPPKGGYEVATITDSINAEWSSGLPIRSGTRVTSSSEPIRLTKGIVKLQTDDQVTVILEAPSEFSFISYSEVSLNYGKLFAHVTEQGYGFSIVTSNSKVVDLGTEFGVISRIDGNTEVYMYKGKANIFAGEKKKRKTSQLLTAGEAVKVDSRDSDIHRIAFDDQATVRNIDSDLKMIWRGQHALRLVDLLLGGNGFGTAAQRSIEYNPVTGEVISPADSFLKYRKGMGKLVPITDSPYLDSIFVPGSGDGNTIVSSQGHQFRECPKTSGLYYANATFEKDWMFFNSLQRTFELSHKHFSDSGLLYLHSNLGLTVDLNAIRRAAPELRVSSFSAFAGIVRLGDTSDEESNYAEADIWVLVDGQVRSHRQALRVSEGYDIQVDIADANRFLTLIVTDGGKEYSAKNPANYYDTCGFAEPVFGLVSP